MTSTSFRPQCVNVICLSPKHTCWYSPKGCPEYRTLVTLHTGKSRQPWILRNGLPLILPIRNVTGCCSNTIPFKYRQTCNISHTLVDNKHAEHTDAVGASSVGVAPTTSTLWIGQRQLRTGRGAFKLKDGCGLYQRFYVMIYPCMKLVWLDWEFLPGTFETDGIAL